MAVNSRAPRVKTPLQQAWETLRRNRLAMTGLALLLVFFLLAIAGTILTGGDHPYLDPNLVRLPDKLKPPLSLPNTAAIPPEALPRLGVYVLGTDELGRDVLARMLQGAKVSLSVGFVAVGISVLIGVILGGIAGYYGETPLRLWRWRVTTVDRLITRLVDIMLCFPTFFLILTVIALLPPSIWNVMIVIGLTSWMGTTRFVRAEILSLREQDFIQAARSLGASDLRIIFRHLIPNSMAPVLVSATIGIASAILTESGLSFLGFGVPPPDASWGNILSDGKKFLFDAPWLTYIPGTAILITVLSFNLFGEGLRDALNPKLKRE
ncbi:MAG: ABC transporter permease [Nitrospinota bacterium]|nr:MAG: ABC transporter permease [Nitrospinota bacterium]